MVKIAKNMKLAWEVVQAICPVLKIKFKYNKEDNSIELEETFYIWSDYKNKEVYGVSVIKNYPGDRITPPDTDVVDLASFNNPIQAVKFAVKKYIEEMIDVLFSDFSEKKYYKE